MLHVLHEYCKIYIQGQHKSWTVICFLSNLLYNDIFAFARKFIVMSNCHSILSLLFLQNKKDIIIPTHTDIIRPAFDLPRNKKGGAYLSFWSIGNKCKPSTG